MTETLDCSDLDQYMGIPIKPTSVRDPIRNIDIRRWAQAMHYPNRLHYDDEFAAVGRYGRLVAPQSFAIAAADGHGCGPAAIGKIPNSHLIFGGDEWWFTGIPIFDGDRVIHEMIPFDYAVKQTKFAGPTCFQRGDNNYYNQSGQLIARQRSTSIRYRRDLAVEMSSLQGEDDPVCSDEGLRDIEGRKLEYIDMLHALAHGKRFWEDVAVGDSLPVRVVGPHSIASFTTEWRAYLFTTWGSYNRAGQFDPADLGFVDEMAGYECDPVMEKINPELTDGAYIGPSRGHLFPRWAKFIGMPRAYGYGASMGAWLLDYMSGWAGEWGAVVHSKSQYRGPAFTGDVTVMTGRVIEKSVDEAGSHLVHLECLMADQNGATMATANAEVQLPTK
ncbi:MaoC dehydratase-like protein [Novosphingobium sp. PhB55]|uniref:FAS1-like dehydratase domain-containing protein n=1 Tax=Novosphingobium sp. PhB55 TaxID=2485106 RepID=UPI00106549F5|nr:MaoC family dehydratase N-terminal domain-containing protein [Novosphingobium sp. PhB55]TDW61518.1 MaoC dehydratase-like protein [Novosphingobium sp. PhB55]